VQQTGATSAVQPVDYQAAAPQYGGFVNPYGANPSAANPVYADR
jgi:hypothetical protein